MYKCTECGLEFEIKPDYCDCGNDEFVLTVLNKETPKTIEIESGKETPNDESIYTQPIQSDDELSKYQEREHRFVFHPAALFIFIFCLLCSLLIIFVWNPVKTSVDSNVDIKEDIETKLIPSIDKLWKESSIVIQPEKNDKVLSNAAEPVNKTTKVSVNKNKVVSPAVKHQSVNKPKQNIVNQVAHPIKSNSFVDESLQKSSETAKKALEAKKKADSEALAAAEQAKKSFVVKQELESYKIKLRNEIGKKIDFTKVIGDGDCVVSFNLDSTGRLINRTFSKQSANITLNNEVYRAVMSTPVYNPPPAGYKNETLRLNIGFKGGNFGITLE